MNDESRTVPVNLFNFFQTFFPGGLTGVLAAGIFIFPNHSDWNDVANTAAPTQVGAAL